MTAAAVEPVSWRGEQYFPSQSILLCAWRGVSVGCLTTLSALLRQGLNKPYDADEPTWGLAVQPGDAAIWRARARVVSAWYKETPDDVFLMIDDDLVFHPDAATRILKAARETRSIVCGAYATKGATHFACQLKEGQRIHFAPDSPLVEIRYPATGFMAVHRDVITALIERGGLPLVNLEYTGGYYPMFLPMLHEYAPGQWEELTEDYAFGERAAQLGFKTYLDPSLYLRHEGTKMWDIHDVLRTAADGTGYLVEVADLDTDEELAHDPRLAALA